MRIKNLINNVLAIAGFISFAGCGGYCDAGNTIGAVLSMAAAIICFYPAVKQFEREEAQREAAHYRYDFDYDEYLEHEDIELPKAQ